MYQFFHPVLAHAFCPSVRFCLVHSVSCPALLHSLRSHAILAAVSGVLPCTWLLLTACPVIARIVVSTTSGSTASCCRRVVTRLLSCVPCEALWLIGLVVAAARTAESATSLVGCLRWVPVSIAHQYGTKNEGMRKRRSAYQLAGFLHGGIGLSGCCCAASAGAFGFW